MTKLVTTLLAAVTALSTLTACGSEILTEEGTTAERSVEQESSTDQALNDEEDNGNQAYLNGVLIPSKVRTSLLTTAKVRPLNNAVRP